MFLSSNSYGVTGRSYGVKSGCPHHQQLIYSPQKAWGNPHLLRDNAFPKNKNKIKKKMRFADDSQTQTSQLVHTN